MGKVLIWGTGNMAKELMGHGINAEILGFIQTKKTEECFMNYPIFSCSSIPKNADYILIANTFSDQIYDICIQEGIDLNKVIFLFRGKNTKYVTSSELECILGEANLTRYQSQYDIISNSFFERDRITYSKLNKRKTFAIDENCLWPIINDKFSKAGSANNYFWQDLWAAKNIISMGTKHHFDIGSRLDGFIAHLLSAGIDVTMIDIRDFPVPVDGLNTIVDDATSLHQIVDESIESMSALCSLEHFGLGRYGDPIDPEACFKCFSNIQNKIKKGGHLFISLPIGRERVEFNAHRVFYADTVVQNFNKMSLVEYSTTTENGIEYNTEIHKYDNDSHNGEFRYGLFHFIKK